MREDTEEWQKEPSFAGLQRVGGVDLSYIKGDDSRACASLVVLSYPGLEVTASNRLRGVPGPAGGGRFSSGGLHKKSLSAPRGASASCRVCLTKPPAPHSARKR